MTEPQPFVREGVYLVVINRGNMQAIFPIEEKDLRQIQGHQMALAAAMQFAYTQAGEPADRPTQPIEPGSYVQLALQWLNGEYLRADISLANQFEGKWEEQEVPEGLRTKYTGKAPYVELNLVDTPIILAR